MWCAPLLAASDWLGPIHSKHDAAAFTENRARVREMSHGEGAQRVRELLLRRMHFVLQVGVVNFCRPLKRA